MKLSHKILACSMPALLLAFLTALIVVPHLVYADDPDFGTINDPLNGEYALYRVDDLVVARSKPDNNNTTSTVVNYVLETQNYTISSQSALVADFPQCWMTGSRQPQQTRIGRFFAYSYDVMVTLLAYGVTATGGNCTAPAGQPNMALHIQSTENTANTATPFTMSASNTALVMDDFNLDGYEDLFIMSSAEVLVATAKNINDSNDGMSFGAPTALPGAGYVAAYDATSGDFNADGLQDVAWIGNDDSVHFATVCPGSVTGTICEGKSELEVLLDPLNSRVVPIDVTSSGDGNGGAAAIVAGNFGSYEGTGLVVIDASPFDAYAAPTYPTRWYQFDANWSMIGGTQIADLSLDGGCCNQSGRTLAVAGRLDWLGQSDQVVVARDLQQYGGGGTPAVMYIYVDVIQFDTAQNTMSTSSTGAIDEHSTGLIFPNNPPWLNGLAVGNFAAIGDNATATDFNLQIAMLRNDLHMHFFTVDPASGFAVSSLSTVALDSALGIYPIPTVNVTENPEPRSLNWLAAGDLQGRSARLGPPSVVRVASHSQPSVILSAPPMHVDYILPDASTSTAWDIVNFSAVPDTYNSSYTMSQTGSNQSSDTDRTSYTYATSQQGGGSFSFKPPYIPSISGSLKTTTQNKHEQVSETYQYTQNEFQYDASTTTGFGDEIWYDVSSFNVYYYPVLGQKICPSDNGNCASNEEQQLYVTFSGPNSTGTGPGPGATTEWYQPVHEPGNIFSYPWNETLLAQQIPGGIDLLTSPQDFYTDDSDQTQHLQWSTGGGLDQTAGSTNTHSYEKSYSLTGGKVVGKILDVNLQGNLDYNDSSSISTLNKSSSSVGASHGIAIAKPGTFLDIGEYQYRVEPYIFGRTPDENSVDTVALTQTITTTGPLQTAFAVDPLDPYAGSWWGSDVSPYTQYIDVALNHPVRWSQSDPSGTQTTLNCLEASGPRYNCMAFNDPIPSDLWNSEFYWMRGLFVTVDGVDGPQRIQATAGENVVLQARVYNYSFMDMPANSSIQVQFYRQEIQGTTPISNSVLIDQVTINPLPGFNSASSPDTPNWALATTTLDTSTLGDTYQIFWVLVWAEDGSGNMVPELPGHGLSAIPGTLTTIGDAPLEMVTFDGEQKTFSNNVGYLHSKFYIAPQTSTPAPTTEPVLTIQNPQVTPSTPASGQRVIVGADIAAASADADAVEVRLYSNAEAWQMYLDNPTELVKPRPFDVEMLPHIAAGKTDRMEVPYRTTACGIQHVVITAQAGPQADVAIAIATFDNGPCTYYFPIVLRGRDSERADQFTTTELPAGVPVANWLPVQKGPFNIMLRVYGVVPGSDVANNTYVPPAVAKSRGGGK